MNNEELKQRLASLEVVEPHGPASADMIKAAEKQLGTQFSPQYCAFLSTFGGGAIGSEDFIGLGGPPHLDIRRITLRLRQKNSPLPTRLLPLRGDGFGNYDCLDTKQPTFDGEYAVVQWNHEAGADQTCELLAESFDGWFESILVMIEETYEK